MPPSTNTNPSTADRVLTGLAKLSLVMRHESWQSAGRRGLTPTQTQILSILAGSPEPIGLKEVSRQMAITMGTASEATAALVAKGLVRKAQSKSDGRLPVQDRFGGLADHSRGGPIGVRSIRGVNGDRRKPRFQGRQRGTNTP
ncbi:MAG: winged helix-turn-helix transcriptional regulator, partial [Planctomycetes bacterium]|nr:winged helix-turn-helix transcriptional regulator [Planctomycetota bacterium]